MKLATVVQLATDSHEVALCWSVFKELRPHLRDADELVARWEVQRREGYSIAFIESEGRVVGAAGFRLMHTLAWGKVLYLDDLVVQPSARGRGLGTTLLKWLQDRAVGLGCDALHLDTGYQRHAAHKAYLSSGFELKCHHLAWQVPK